MNLKAKILFHLMGTLKLFDEFLNEPLQWCDIKFDNLGLAADYPKRLVHVQEIFSFHQYSMKFYACYCNIFLGKMRSSTY